MTERIAVGDTVFVGNVKTMQVTRHTVRSIMPGYCWHDQNGEFFMGYTYGARRVDMWPGNCTGAHRTEEGAARDMVAYLQHVRDDLATQLHQAEGRLMEAQAVLRKEALTKIPA